MLTSPSRWMLSAVSNGGATVRKVPSSGAFEIFTVVDAVPSVAPPVGLLRVILKLVAIVPDPFLRMGMGMVLIVSFSINGSVPETAW